MAKVKDKKNKVVGFQVVGDGDGIGPKQGWSSPKSQLHSCCW